MLHSSLCTLVLGVFLGAAPAIAGGGDQAQKLEGAEAEKLARLCTEALGKSDRPAPVKVTPDVKRSLGLKAREVVVLLVPDAKLTAKALEKADREIIPLGLLLTKRVTVVPVYEPVPAASHRAVEITVGDNTARITVMHLAATRVAGRLVLLVYADGNTPVLVTTLVEAERATGHVLNVEPRPQRDDRALLFLGVLDRFEAAFLIAASD